MAGSVRVLTVEDDLPTRSALDVSLTGEGYQVRSEVSGSGIEKVLERFRPHLAVLDVRLPEGPDGLALARTVRRVSDIPIIVLSSADGETDRLAGFDAGVDDYLAKPFSMAEFLARTRALLRRAGHGSTTFQVGDLLLDEAAHHAVRGDTVLELTRTEFKLLAVLARHKKQILSKPQLFRHVWGFENFGANLIEVHVSTLRRKLEVAGPRIIHTIRGVGYVLHPCSGATGERAEQGPGHSIAWASA